MTRHEGSDALARRAKLGAAECGDTVSMPIPITLAGSRTIAAFGARVGLATGFPRTKITTTADGQTVTQTVDDLPPSERFFAGGDTTVRGFTLDRLGRPDTIDATGFPKGGHATIASGKPADLERFFSIFNFTQRQQVAV